MTNAPSLTVSESFKKRADSAAFYEAWVGAVLARAGLYTVHHPFTIASDHTSIATYGHTWDLDVSGLNPLSESPDSVQVEVKSLSQAFRNPSDYPFQEVLVCSQKSWLTKWPKALLTPRDFLYVSRETGSVLWLPRCSHVRLGVDVYDKSRNELYKAVQAKKTDLKDLAAFTEYVHEETDKAISSR